MYKDAEEFRPTHTIWIYGNHKPKIDGNYSAIERLMKIL
jgi:phage/plasmid-associated DNA primase